MVAIIAILASIVLVGFGSFKARARDSRRVADLHQVQNMLELYYTKFHYYPNVGDYAAMRGTLTDIIATNIGINSVPDDPLGGTAHYLYAASNSIGPGPQNYEVGAWLEDANNPVFQDAPAGPVGGLACASTGGSNGNEKMYCVGI